MTYSKRCPPILCTTLHHVSNVTSLRIDCRFNSTPHLFHIFALKLCSLTMRLCTFKRHLNCFRAASFGEKRLSPPPTAMPILLRCFFSTCSKKKRKKKENFNGNLHAGQPAGRYGYCLLPRDFFYIRRRKSALTENVAATHAPRGWIDLRKLPREPVWKAILPRI